MGGRSDKKRAYLRGIAAEKAASFLLKVKGYRILRQRYKTPVGEIDLIAEKGNVLAFIEVKERGTQVQALESLTPRMRSRIQRAAEYYLSVHPGYAGRDLRFDLIVISLPFFMRHLDNAWRPAA